MRETGDFQTVPMLNLRDYVMVCGLYCREPGGLVPSPNLLSTYPAPHSSLLTLQFSRKNILYVVGHSDRWWRRYLDMYPLWFALKYEILSICTMSLLFKNFGHGEMTLNCETLLLFGNSVEIGIFSLFSTALMMWFTSTIDLRFYGLFGGKGCPD